MAENKLNFYQHDLPVGVTFRCAIDRCGTSQIKPRTQWFSSENHKDDTAEEIMDVRILFSSNHSVRMGPIFIFPR
jgi:hypothetical protein